MSKLQDFIDAVDALEYAAWEHGFRDTPGGMGTTPYVQSLEGKRKLKKAALLDMLKAAFPEDEKQEDQ